MAKQVSSINVLANPSGRLAVGVIDLQLHGARVIATNAYQNLAASGGIVASNSTPILERTNGATDIAQRLNWAATVVNEIQFPAIARPFDLDPTANVTVNLLIDKNTNTDTSAVVQVKFFPGIGGTDAGGNSAAINTTTATVYSVSIAAANIGTFPGMWNVALVPGTHANDAIRLYGAWLQYGKRA